MRPRAFIGFQVKNFCPSNRTAFTRAELIATLAGLFLCLAVLVPSFANNGPRSEQVSCLSNLRQIGIAFQTWGNEHDDRRPWFVPTDVPRDQGGTRGHPLMNNAFIHFTALSNYISPTLLSDPGETGRNKRVARTWTASPEGGWWNANFRDNALSYILGVHTTVTEAANVLTADRNVFFNGYEGCALGFSPVLRLDLASWTYRGWTNGNHGASGNVLLNDGRVEHTSSQRLYFLLFRPNNDSSFGGHYLAPAQ